MFRKNNLIWDLFPERSFLIQRNTGKGYIIKQKCSIQVLVWITRHCKSHLKLWRKRDITEVYFSGKKPKIKIKPQTSEEIFIRPPFNISSLSRRNNWDIKEISFVIFLSYGHIEVLAASLTLRVLLWNIWSSRFELSFIIRTKCS